MTLSSLMEEQDFSIWKVNKSTLEDDVDLFSKEINDISGNTSATGGLTSEEIRTSDKYKDANSRYKIAFKKLQDFNKNSPKGFLKKLSTEERKKRYNL